jgi:hypothetical protein
VIWRVGAKTLDEKGRSGTERLFSFAGTVPVPAGRPGEGLPTLGRFDAASAIDLDHCGILKLRSAGRSPFKMEVTMTEPDSTERENPTLQVDPVLTLSGGQMTFGQKLICGIVAIVVVLGTLYGLVHQRGEMRQSPAILAVYGWPPP